MTGRFTSRDGMRRERIGRLPSPPRFHTRGQAQPPSVRQGASWRALPVEGSKAWRRNHTGFLGRLLAR